MSLVAIVRGEEELGLQRFCPDCRSWWPDTAEFFVRWAHWSSPRCRSCDTARHDAAAALRRRTADSAATEARRETWRLQQAARRAGALGRAL